MTLFLSLRHRPFAFLWSGQAVSRLGDSLYRIALAWWVLEKTGSAVAMGTVLILTTIPMLLFLLIGGVAVDRLPRGRVMLAADLLRGIVVGAVAFLAFANVLLIWHIYVASIVFGLVEAFFQPAYSALVPEITPLESLPSANSLTDLSMRFTGILGPALGALIVGVGGTASAFALDAVSFFVSAICLIPIVGLGLASREKAASGGVLSDLREGIATVLQSPWLWVTIGIFAFINITLSGPMGVALPFLIKDSLHADVGGLGLVYSASSLGAIVGAVWLGRFRRIRHRGLLAYGSAFVSGLMVLAFGVGIPLVGVAAAALVSGICLAFFGLVWTNTLQEMVPRQLLGRVSSIDMLGSFVFLPMGFGVAGWATDLVGAPLVFIVGGAVSAVLVALGLLHPAIRGLD